MKNPRSLIYCFLFTCSSIAQTHYYFDAVDGNDAYAGTSSSAAWKNLSRLYSVTLSAGSTVNLKCGCVWTDQQLKFSGSGAAGNPIVINQYGTGAKPVLHGNGLTGQGVVYLFNQEYIEINNLEITNDPQGPDNAHFFLGLYAGGANNPNPTGGDRKGVMVAIDRFGTADHIYLKNLDIHHIKGQLGSGSIAVNGATPKRTGGIFFTVLGVTELSTSRSRFNDVLIDGCTVYYCENIGLALDNEWNVFYPGGRYSSIAADVTEYNNWYDRRFTNIKISNNVIHHIGKNAMIIRCTDETGLIEYNTCFETALGTTGNTMFTARAKGTVFQYNEGCFNRGTTQKVDSGNIDGSMYDPDYSSVGIIFQYSYSHDNSEGIYWGCNTRSQTNNNAGVPDPNDRGCTLRYCVSQNDKGDLIFFNYPSAGNEIYNNVFFIGSGVSPAIIHESGDRHTYGFYNNIIYNPGNTAGYVLKTTGQTRSLSNNVFYGVSTPAEIADAQKSTADPMFISPGSGALGLASLDGYILNRGSPAIANGKLITDNGGKDFYGNSVSSTVAPNRGCYEGAGEGTATAVFPVDPVVNNKVMVYPVPAGFQIRLALAGFEGKILLLRIVGIDGKVYQSVTTKNTTAVSLNLPKITTGMYFVKIFNKANNKPLAVVPFIKQ